MARAPRVRGSPHLPGAGWPPSRHRIISSPGRFRLVRLLRAEPVFSRCCPREKCPRWSRSRFVRPAFRVVMRRVTDLPAGSGFAFQTPPGAWNMTGAPGSGFRAKNPCPVHFDLTGARAGRDVSLARLWHAIRLPRPKPHHLPPARTPSALTIRWNGRFWQYRMAERGGENLGGLFW